MGQAVRFQETLRRLAMIDEGFVQDQAGSSASSTIAEEAGMVVHDQHGGGWMVVPQLAGATRLGTMTDAG